MEEIRQESRVNVSYAKPDKNRFVSVSGTATLINDKAKIDEFWDPIYKVFFPEGKDDPKLRLLKVNVEKAEYWTTGNLVATAIGFVKALAGKESELGENEKLTLA